MRAHAHFFCLWGLSLAAVAWWLTQMAPWGGTVRLGAVLAAAALWLAWGAWRLWRWRRDEAERELLLPGLQDLPQGWRRGRAAVVELESRRGAYVAAEDGVLRVMVPTPALLERAVAELAAWRQGSPPDALALRLEAAAECSEPAWLGRLQAWRQAIADVEGRLTCRLPVYLLVGFPAPARCAGINELLGVVLQGAPCSSLRQWRERLEAWRSRMELQPPALGDEDARARFDLRLRAGAVGGWLGAQVLPALLQGAEPTPAPRLQGIALLPAQGRDAALSPWGRCRQALSGLAVRSLSMGKSEWEGVPRGWLFGLEPGGRLSAAWRLALRLWLLACLTALATFAASAWSNRELLERLSANVAHYRALPVERDAERRQALRTLESDARELQSHADLGVPLRLGFGFYRAQPWRERIARLIAEYRPPTAAPASVSLDSLSLFDSGKAVLRTGAEAALQPALAALARYPERNVLVAGHTDSVGQAESNQRLSLERAAAVRDWLAQASGLPLTRFAIQGYGATRPVASNDDAEGRARNRRVEITLLPAPPVK
ncbi:OmpA family protein [Chromobacterium alkanivorans]|uniref:OmpA family protein n=1 Tax=Chromobacterium alkanivorans TaxID=1071719 RepID=UPI0019680784|nr:OmpA family protein [Chromobacterium alkanivorans]MBN3006729.1 OmpA family protein [Chromobacterium alkanivorans]